MDIIPFEKLPPEILSDTISRRYVSGEKGMIARFELKKGAFIAEHQHPHEQISYILSGKVKVTVATEELILNSGEVLVIPSNMPHQFEALEDTINIDVFTPPREDWLSRNS